jgi:hypothetical protein
MLPVNVTQLFPDKTPPPEPPGAARFRLQVALENADSEWRSQVRKEYGSKLPIVIPAHWTRERVMHFANGGQHPQPAFIATIGTRISAFRKRSTEGQLAA